MKVKYVGPHDGVVVEDALSGFHGECERDGTVEVPDEVGRRLLDQDIWKKVNSKPAAESGEEV